MITDRDLHILRFLRRFKFCTVAQIRDAINPADEDGAVTRSLMRKLDAAGLARSFKAQVVDPTANSTAPVWVPTEKGCCLLATRTGDMSLLLDAAPNTKAWQHFGHWAAVTGLVMTLDRALSLQERVRLTALYFEHDILHPEEADPARRFRLYAVVSERPKKIVCAPDFAFEIQAGLFRRAYYGEFETGSEESPARCAAIKHQGYAGLAEQNLFRRHFPEASDMRVIAFCPNPSWRDALRRAMQDKPGAGLWRFVAVQEITNNFLHEPVMYTCTAGPLPFVSPAVPPPAALPMAEE